MRILLPLLAGVITAIPQLVATTVTPRDIAILAVTFTATTLFVAFVQWFDACQAQIARASDIGLVREMIRRNDTLEFFDSGPGGHRLERLARPVVVLAEQALNLTPWRRSAPRMNAYEVNRHHCSGGGISVRWVAAATQHNPLARPRRSRQGWEQKGVPAARDAPRRQ